jgi:hypothetical protein
MSIVNSHKHFTSKYAVLAGAALGLMLGTLYWLALCAYLHASDHAWWTGASSTSGHDWRIILARIGLHPSYWQLPAVCMLLGALLGALVQGLQVNCQLVWQAFRFGCIALAKNWYWLLAVLLLPFSNLLAVFFTGHRTAYSEPPEQFRLRWSFPGWLAVVLCFLVSASDIFLGAITTAVHWLFVAAALQLPMAIYSALANQVCAGVWLEKYTTLAGVRLLMSHLLRPAAIRDAAALEVFLLLLAVVLLFPPIFLAATFLIYEAPQLDANMKTTGITAPAIFVWVIYVFDQVVNGYAWLFFIAPFTLFSSICNAKLFQLSQAPR